jgi:hypothetical protein
MLEQRGILVSDRIPIERSKWQKPIYQGHYDEQAEFYEGIRCRCRKCELSFVFTASQQRDSFERNGKYPGWQPSLCPKCHSKFLDLVLVEAAYSEKWEKEGDAIPQSEAFLKEWLSVLVHAESFRRQGFGHKIGMVKKRLREHDAGCA